MGVVIGVVVALLLVAMLVGFVRMLINDQRGENAKRRAARKQLEEDDD